MTPLRDTKQLYCYQFPHLQKQKLLFSANQLLFSGKEQFSFPGHIKAPPPPALLSGTIVKTTEKPPQFNSCGTADPSLLDQTGICQSLNLLTSVFKASMILNIVQGLGGHMFRPS